MTDRERRILEEHGTKLMQLKPSSIWAAAMADLEKRKHNRLVAEGKSFDPYERYAFHRDHVENHLTPNDLIRAAIAEPGKGAASGKANTRLIYSDTELLKRSLR